MQAWTRRSAGSPAGLPGRDGIAGVGGVSGGFVAVWAARPAAWLVVLPLAGTLLFGADQVLMPAVSRSPLRSGASDFRWLPTGLDLGRALGAPLVPRLASRRGLAVAVAAGFVVFAAPTGILAASHSADLDVAVEVVRGAGTMMADLVGFTAMQTALPATARDQELGAFFALVAAAPGSLAASGLLGVLGLRLTLIAFDPPAAGLALVGLPLLSHVLPLAPGQTAGSAGPDAQTAGSAGPDAQAPGAPPDGACTRA